MTRPSEDDLQRYHDGELSPSEVAEVDRYLVEAPEARALLRDFETVGEAVRRVAGARGAAAEGIAERVMARIDGGAAPGPAATPGTRGSASRWLRLAPPFGLGVAAAAAAVLYLRAPEAPLQGPIVPPRPSAGLFAVAEQERPVSSAADPVAAETESDEGAAIEAVDFGAQNGTIFMVATERGGAEMTPVVWLMDEGDSGEDRMKPL